jgi:hypothetical protein
LRRRAPAKALWLRGNAVDGGLSRTARRRHDLLEGIVRALSGKPSKAEAEIAAILDMASTLRDAARRGDEHAIPTAVILPVGACAGAFGWFGTLGRRRILAETKALLSVPDDATFEHITTAAWAAVRGL